MPTDFFHQVYIGFIDNDSGPARGHIFLLARFEEKVIPTGSPSSK